MSGKYRVVLFLVASLLTAHLSSGAELDEVKAKYAEASYEAALQALDKLEPAVGRTPEAHQYRALCLLALGRSADAQQAIEAVITAAPSLIPSSEEFPPRFIALFTETRRRVLPLVVAKTFADAREGFKTSKNDEALTQFQKVLALLTDPMLAGAANMEDTRTLASGYVDLLRGRLATPASPTAARTSAPGPGGTVGPAAPGSVASGSPTSRVPAPPVVVQSVAVRQDLPRWIAPDRAAAAREWTGSVKVLVGADGRVKSASMERRMHPAYESLLIAATRNWLYRPATTDGQPVASERVIEIRLKPSTP